MKSESSVDSLVQSRLDRRNFFRQAGMLGLGAATAGLAAPAIARAATSSSIDPNQAADTVAEIFTAALIAEDLATTFYYNGLIGPVIQDPSLAGPGGAAWHITSSGNLGNVYYLRAAMSEEISHANLFRGQLKIASAANDPVQTFYFPSGSFDTLAAFTGLLDALENAFIGAYLNAIQELGQKVAGMSANGGYNQTSLIHWTKVLASVMGIESEHRVLGRVISNTNPANNLNYEQTDGLTAVYNGPTSAVAALTPFLTPSTGPGYSFAEALAGRGKVNLNTTGNPPV